ncbi:MAG: DsbA family protein [Gemmatimonadaceae bacterium]|nr:DsbA family protein [Gemmatimonadaceae bacterium]
MDAVLLVGGCTAAVLALWWQLESKLEGRRAARETLSTREFAEVYDGATELWAAAGQGGGGPSKGVRVVIFTDFQCPFCALLHKDLTRLHESDSLRGVAVSIRHAPASRRHPLAWRIALGAECASLNGRAKAYADSAFGWQLDIADHLDSLAGIGGRGDGVRWRSCLESERTRMRLQSDTLLARKYGVRGTPTMFVNGQRVTGAVPSDSLLRLLSTL